MCIKTEIDSVALFDVIFCNRAFCVNSLMWGSSSIRAAVRTTVVVGQHSPTLPVGPGLALDTKCCYYTCDKPTSRLF